MAKKKKGADGEDVHEGGFCWCTRDLAAIFIFAVGGLTLLLPGFMLRLENVDSPTPYVYISLCPTANKFQYVGSASNCTAGVNVPTDQYLTLNPVLLVSGVKYVPAIVRSNSITSGVISIKMSDKDDNTMMDFTTKLSYRGPEDTDESIDLKSFIKEDTRILVYRSPGIVPAQNMMCEDIRLGCRRELTTDMNKLILKQHPFEVPRANIVDPTLLYASFHTKLSIKVSGLTAMVDKENANPELYLVFQQMTLSALQYRGVIYIITGAATVFVALSLTCLHWFAQRRKEMTRAAGEHHE